MLLFYSFCFFIFLFYYFYVPLISRDDHDVTADNARENGTANPVPDVTFQRRKCAAVQAWHEYLPIRRTAANVGGLTSEGASATGNCSDLLDIYRTFRFGSTMTLVGEGGEARGLEERCHGVQGGRACDFRVK